MAAITSGAHACSSNDWERKRKMLPLVMIFVDDEAPVMLERRMWSHQWLLRILLRWPSFRNNDVVSQSILVITDDYAPRAGQFTHGAL